MMEQALLEYVINALWQVPLLAGGAWLLLRMVRPSPLVQHHVWLAVLGLAVLLPMRGMGFHGVSATRIQRRSLRPVTRSSLPRWRTTNCPRDAGNGLRSVPSSPRGRVASG